MFLENSWLTVDRFADEPNPTPTPTPTPEEKKTFTQDELNAFLAEDRRKTQARLKELEKVAGNAEELKKKLKETQDSFLTKEQLTAQEAEAQRTAWETERTGLTGQRDFYRGKHEELIVENAIARGAVEHNAFDAKQLELLLKPSTKVVEETDAEGKGTGVFKSMTTITDKEGKQLILPTAEAIGKIREFGQFANQFRAGTVPGTGQTLNNEPAQGNPMAGGKVPSMSEMSSWVRKTNIVR